MSLLKGKIGDRDSDTAGMPPPLAKVTQRVRVGLTGLAAIFLLVLVAAAGLRPSQSAAAPGNADEPLAMLGVAPGAGPATVEPKRAMVAPQGAKPRRAA